MLLHVGLLALEPPACSLSAGLVTGHQGTLWNAGGRRGGIEGKLETTGMEADSASSDVQRSHIWLFTGCWGENCDRERYRLWACGKQGLTGLRIRAGGQCGDDGDTWLTEESYWDRWPRGENGRGALSMMVWGVQRQGLQGDKTASIRATGIIEGKWAVFEHSVIAELQKENWGGAL